MNALVGTDVQAIGDVRAGDQRGRHTTTARDLVPIPGGGVLIDTPGLRAVSLWDADEGLSRVFADIEALAATCKFSDCAHDSEPGCAIRAAIARGELDPARLDSYNRLDQELDKSARRREGREMSKVIKQYYKLRPDKKRLGQQRRDSIRDATEREELTPLPAPEGAAVAADEEHGAPLVERCHREIVGTGVAGGHRRRRARAGRERFEDRWLG